MKSKKIIEENKTQIQINNILILQGYAALYQLFPDDNLYKEFSDPGMRYGSGYPRDVPWRFKMTPRESEILDSKSGKIYVFNGEHIHLLFFLGGEPDEGIKEFAKGFTEKLDGELPNLTSLAKREKFIKQLLQPISHLFVSKKRIEKKVSIEEYIEKNKIQSRVFISCGQASEDERVIAKEITKKLLTKGYDPYIAVEEHTVRGLKENIFQKLATSEYFLFIDFKRERLSEIKSKKFRLSKQHRGSLFTNQELAIASFLNIDTLGFQEEGVKELDGLIPAIQLNCIPFKDRKVLPDIISKVIEDQGWRRDWRNELALIRDSKVDFEDAIRQRSFQVGPDIKIENTLARYYHIRVANLHKEKIARNCICYLESIKNLSTNEETRLELVEFKWKGVIRTEISIPASQHRSFDAFYVYHDTPDEIWFGLNEKNTDFSKLFFDYHLEVSGDYELNFIVFSETFSPAKATFKLHIGTSLEQITCSII